MVGFFDKPFNEQVAEIIKSEDLELLQAFIGTRSLIGLSIYCTSFFLAKAIIMQVQHRLYSTLLNLLDEYKNFGKDSVLEKVEEVIRKSKDELHKELLLPELGNILLSLTDERFDFGSVSRVKREVKGNGSISSNITGSSDPVHYLRNLTGYTQHTDISSLCILNSQQVADIYDNLAATEEHKLQDLLSSGK